MASPRTGVKSFKDLSPARKRLAMNDTLSPEPEDKDPTNPWRRRYHSLSPQRSFQIIKDEQKTCLISGKDIGSEYRKKKEDEQLRFKNMDSELTGQNAEAVFRDLITGKRISTEEYLKSKPEKLVQELEWCKGLAQEREAEARLHELEHEKTMPFARTRDDPELDQMMKERVRWGDPMAHLVKKTQHEPSSLVDLGDDEKMRESGFVIPQNIPKHSSLTRRLEAAANGYGIKAGRHWDGVHHSNGYENYMLNKRNKNKATEREAYLWSVSDM